MFFNILTSHCYISGVYFGGFVIILVEINVEASVSFGNVLKRLLYMVKLREWDNYRIVKDTGQF